MVGYRQLMSGVEVDHAEELEFQRRRSIELAHDDAQSLGVATGDRVRATWKGGAATGPALVNRRLRTGVVRLATAVPHVGPGSVAAAERRRRPMPDGFIVTAIKSLVLVNLVMLTFAVLTWVERRLIGRFQVRLGPNRVGPIGLLQPIADLGKLLHKESIIPIGGSPFLYLAAPAISLFAALSVFGAIPFGEEATIPFTDWQIYLYIATSTSRCCWCSRWGRSRSTASWSAAGRPARSTRCTARCGPSPSWCRTRWR